MPKKNTLSKYNISLVTRPHTGPENEASTTSPPQSIYRPTSLNHLLHLSFCNHNSGYTFTLAYRIGYFRPSLVEEDSSKYNGLKFSD